MVGVYIEIALPSPAAVTISIHQNQFFRSTNPNLQTVSSSLSKGSGGCLIACPLKA
jgi:hypothetical protein